MPCRASHALAARARRGITISGIEGQRMLRHRSLSRRRLLASALVGGVTVALPWETLAQDASPAAAGEVMKSPAREEYTAEYVEAMGYTEAATPGGTYIDSNIADIQSMHPFLAEEDATVKVVSLVYETLIGGDYRTGKPTPTALADS